MVASLLGARRPLADYPLDTWREALRHPVPGEEPLAPAVRVLIERYGLSREDFLEIIAGMEMVAKQLHVQSRRASGPNGPRRTPTGPRKPPT